MSQWTIPGEYSSLSFVGKDGNHSFNNFAILSGIVMTKIILCKQISACVILLYFHAATRDDVESISYVKMT